MEEALIRVKDLCKIYNPGENEVRALDHINLEINKGEFVAIIGLFIWKYLAGYYGYGEQNEQ